MDPIIMAYPIYWLAFKLLIAARGPGVGGIKVWEVYNPPDKERLRLANEIFELDTIDFEILFKIKKPESQNTTIPKNSPKKFNDNIELFLNFESIRFPNILIDPLSFKNSPIIILKTIINPIDFKVLPNPFLMESIISNNGKPISIPHKKQAKKRLKIGCQLNFDVVIIINKIDNAKYKNIIILILY